MRYIAISVVVRITLPPGRPWPWSTIHACLGLADPVELISQCQHQHQHQLLHHQDHQRGLPLEGRPYGVDKVAMPLLDTEALIRQASVFRDTMMQVVPLVKQRRDLALALAEADKAKPAPPALTTIVSQQIGNNAVASR